MVVTVEMKPAHWRRHPERARFHQRVEGSPLHLLTVGGDPSLRLKSGSVQDDATDLVPRWTWRTPISTQEPSPGTSHHPTWVWRLN